MLEESFVMCGDQARKKRLDWERWIETGAMKNKPQAPPDPLLQKALSQITLDGGRFILEHHVNGGRS